MEIKTSTRSGAEILTGSGPGATWTKEVAVEEMDEPDSPSDAPSAAKELQAKETELATLKDQAGAHPASWERCSRLLARGTHVGGRRPRHRHGRSPRPAVERC